MIVLQILALFVGFYALSSFLGTGLYRLLAPSDRQGEAIFAPWLGIVQTGWILILFGWIGLGTGKSFGIAILASVGFYAASSQLEATHLKSEWGKKAILAMIGAALSVLLLWPLVRTGRLAGFAAGSHEIFNYALCARQLQDDGFGQALRPFADQPAPPEDTTGARVLSRQMSSPTWLTYYYLSFLSSIFQLDPARIFSLYLAFLYLLSWPVLWRLITSALGLTHWAARAAFALTLANPHILRILYSGSLSQIMATGFFLCFLCCWPDYLKKKEFDRKLLALSALFAAGAFASLFDLFSLLVFVSVLSIAIALRQNSISETFKRWGAWSLTVVVLSPMQTAAWMASALNASSPISPWPLTSGPFGFAYPLGIYFGDIRQVANMAEFYLAPVLACFLLFGWTRLKSRGFWLLTAAPFLGACAFDYVNGWNDRFYRNFTLAYFWLPITLGASLSGFWNLERWRFLKSAFYFAAFSIVLATFLLSTRNSLEYLHRAPAQIVPVELRFLQEVNQEPGQVTIGLEGLSFWETLWAGYYLKDKNLLTESANAYLGSEAASTMEPSVRRFLVRKHASVLPTLQNRLPDSTIAETESYALYDAPLSTAAGPRVWLGEGFYPTEGNARDQWAWMEPRGEIFISSGGAVAQGELKIDYSGLQKLNFAVSVNGLPAGSFSSMPRVHSSTSIPVALVQERNSVEIRCDSEVPSSQQDPRRLALQIFKIRLELSHEPGI